MCVLQFNFEIASHQQNQYKIDAIKIFYIFIWEIVYVVRE